VLVEKGSQAPERAPQEEKEQTHISQLVSGRAFIIHLRGRYGGMEYLPSYHSHCIWQFLQAEHHCSNTAPTLLYLYASESASVLTSLVDSIHPFPSHFPPPNIGIGFPVVRISRSITTLGTFLKANFHNCTCPHPTQAVDMACTCFHSLLQP
jgi:hypothetical protein